MKTRHESKIALMIGGIAILMALAPAPQEPQADDSVPALAKARVAVCERMLDFYRESSKAPAAPGDPVKGPADRYAAGYEPIELWSSRLLEARLEAASGKDERLAILADEVKRVEGFSTEIKAVARDEPEWKVVADRVEFDRLEAKSRLAREKAAR